MAKNTLPEKKDDWRGFYNFAGICGLFIVLVGLLDTILSMTSGEAAANSTISTLDWFAMLADVPVTALSNLGLINFITLSLGIPVYLAFHNLFRPSRPAFSTLAAVLFFMGAAVYFATNTLFPMLALSGQYEAASETRKILLETAGNAVLAMGADLTPGTLAGLMLVQLGGFGMALVMLQSGLFGKWTAWFGVAGFGCMLVFFPLAAFMPEQFGMAMPVSMVGGLALMVYHVLFARGLFRFGGTDRFSK